MALIEHKVIQELYNLSDERMLQTILDHKEMKVSEELLIVFAVLYGLIAIGAIVGNILVILVVATKKNMHTVTNTLVANLAVSDVALGMFTIPFQFQATILQKWSAAEFMCKVAPFVKDVSVNVSVLSLTVIALDRYIAVMFPLKAGIQKKTALLVFLFIWILSILSAVPTVLYFEIGKAYVSTKSHFVLKKICNPKYPSHRFMTVHTIYLALTQYIVPLTIITFSYTRITVRVWGNTLQGVSHNDKNTAGRSSLRTANRRKVRLIISTSFIGPVYHLKQTSDILKISDKYKNHLLSLVFVMRYKMSSDFRLKCLF